MVPYSKKTSMTFSATDHTDFHKSVTQSQPEATGKAYRGEMKRKKVPSPDVRHERTSHSR